MVLHLKVWESKTLPGLLASQIINKHDAGWSSPVARQAHNLKVVGSNPTPATNYSIKISQIFFSNVFFTTPHNFMWNHAFVINIIQFIQF